MVGDWGFAAMTWVGFGAISPNGRLYLYRELTWIKTKIEDWAPVVKDCIERDGNVKFVKFCQSAGQDRGQEHTIQQQISTALGREILLTGNSSGSRVAGKMLIHEYLRWKPKPVIPESEKPAYNEAYAMQIYRLKGEAAHANYMQIFESPEVEKNLPKLLIFKNCPAVVAAIKAASYDKKRVEDIAEFSGDDPIDGLRYLVDAAEQFVATSVKEMEKVQKQEHFTHLLNTSNDWTAFYRNMEHLENKSSQIPHVARYRRRA